MTGSTKLMTPGGGGVTIQPASSIASDVTVQVPSRDCSLRGTGESVLVSDTAKTASGTSVDFTGIPSWVKRITVMFSGLSLSGTDDTLVQLGVSGDYSATYASAGSAMGSGAITSTNTTGFIMCSAAAASILSGSMVIFNISGNNWVSSHNGKQSASVAITGGGDVSLSGTLTSIRIKATGTNTFDAGSINILYE